MYGGLKNFKKENTYEVLRWMWAGLRFGCHCTSEILCESNVEENPTVISDTTKDIEKEWTPYMYPIAAQIRCFSTSFEERSTCDDISNSLPNKARRAIWMRYLICMEWNISITIRIQYRCFLENAKLDGKAYAFAVRQYSWKRLVYRCCWAEQLSLLRSYRSGAESCSLVYTGIGMYASQSQSTRILVPQEYFSDELIRILTHSSK